MAKKTTKVVGNSGEFKLGHKKLGGRKPNTPNKKTMILIDSIGSFDPAATLVEVAEECKKNGNWELLAKICFEFMRYLYPQRKAVEMTAEVGATESTQEVFLNYLKGMGEKK